MKTFLVLIAIIMLGIIVSLASAQQMQCANGVCRLINNTNTKSFNLPTYKLVPMSTPIPIVSMPTAMPTAIPTTMPIVPVGSHAHRAHNGQIIVHSNSNNGVPGAHNGMSTVRIAEGGSYRSYRKPFRLFRWRR